TQGGLFRVSMVDDSNRPISTPDGPSYSAPARREPGALSAIETDGEARRVVVLDPGTGEPTGEVSPLAGAFRGVYRHWWSATDHDVYYWLEEGGTVHRAEGGASEVVA